LGKKAERVMKCDVFPGETQAQFSPLLNQYQDRSRQKTKIRAANFMERQDSDMMDIQNKPPSLNVIPDRKNAFHHKEGYTRTSSLKLKTGRL